MNTLRNVTIVVALVASIFSQCQAAIVYSTSGSTYTENFNSLPTDAPTNASIETLYPNGWRDDTTTVPGSHVSLPGWYLHHPFQPATENGFNGNQRFRFGDGSSDVGSFYAFANGPNAAANAEKALGSLPYIDLALPATDVAQAMSLHIGLRLTNNTGKTLTQYVIMYDLEQWRDGVITPHFGEHLDFGVSTDSFGGATTDNWFSTGGFAFSGIIPPIAPVTGPVDAPVDGNIAGKVTVTHVLGPQQYANWLPGQDLWLRWRDPNGNGNDDGLAIDNFSFTAFVPEPNSVMLLGMAIVAISAGRTRNRWARWPGSSPKCRF